MSAIVLEIVLTCVGCLYCGKNPSFHIEYAWQAFLYQSQSDGPRRCQYHLRLIRCQQTVVYCYCFAEMAFFHFVKTKKQHLKTFTFSQSTVRGPSPRRPKLGKLKYVGRRHDGLIIWRHTFRPSTMGDITASSERDASVTNIDLFSRPINITCVCFCSSINVQLHN